MIERLAETSRATTLILDVPGWPGHLAGQHVDVRLTADDGYQAQRSYSIASPPEVLRLALTVTRLEDGEVSPWLVDEARPGDRLELRGPIGGYFAWSITAGGPLLLVAGGSGVAPLMAMLRHRAASGEAGRAVPARLLLSSRSFADIIYREELERLGSAPGGPDRSHPYARAAAAGLARSCPANRRADAGRGRVPARGGAQGVRLRPDADGGGGRRGAGWARARARARQDRAFRRNRRRMR